MELERTLGETERREAMFSIVERWAAEDMDAAGEWLGYQGNAEETWPARRCFARIAAMEDPGAALAWLETIGDEGMRRAGFVDVVDSWTRTHPDTDPDMGDWSAVRRRAWEELSSVVERR